MTGQFGQGGVWPGAYQAALTKPSLLMQRLKRVQERLEDRACCLNSVPGYKECWQRRQSKPCSRAPRGSWSLAVMLGHALGCFWTNHACREEG